MGCCIAYVPFAAGCFQTKWPNPQAAKVLAKVKAELVISTASPAPANAAPFLA